MKTITITGYGGVTAQIEVEDDDPRVVASTPEVPKEDDK